MSSSTEPKTPTTEINIEGEDSQSNYNVEEDDESEKDHFSNAKTKFLRTPSILNAIIEQIHPEIIAKYV